MDRLLLGIVKLLHRLLFRLARIGMVVNALFTKLADACLNVRVAIIPFIHWKSMRAKCFSGRLQVKRVGIHAVL